MRKEELLIEKEIDLRLRQRCQGRLFCDDCPFFGEKEEYEGGCREKIAIKLIQDARLGYPPSAEPYSLAEMRKKAGHSQAQLAHLLGIHITTLLNYELKRRVPDLILSVRLASVLKVSLDDIVRFFEGVIEGDV